MINSFKQQGVIRPYNPRGSILLSDFLDVSGQIRGIAESRFAFNPNLTTVLVTDSAMVYEYELKIPGLLASGKYTGRSFDNVNGIQGMKYNGDGSALFLSDITSDNIQQRNLGGTPYSLESVSGIVFQINLSLTPRQFQFFDDGKQFAYTASNSATLDRYIVSTPYALNAILPPPVESFVSTTNEFHSFFITNDGKTLFNTRTSGAYGHYQMLTGEWVSSTLTDNNTVLPYYKTIRDIWFNNDGTKMYLIDQETRRIISLNTSYLMASL